jgi:hypothetical protein
MRDVNLKFTFAYKQPPTHLIETYLPPDDPFTPGDRTDLHSMSRPEEIAPPEIVSLDQSLQVMLAV